MLSENFSIKELIKSQTAERQGINNNPGADEIHYMKMLAEKILQPVRDYYELPFTVSSGYRCPELSIQIGSSKKSQHCKGQAADFEVPGISNMDLCSFIRYNLEFDQLILECYTGGNTGWVHCSVSDEPRAELLTYDRQNGYRKGLIDDSKKISES
jgi:zinc D-Ala-D-Ala carboxypeptidase|tara:strand:- start:65 stop:532 length:468 start_codon:yes stop_codon:yes gene_type:complete